MNDAPANSPQADSAFSVLRRFARPRKTAVERCELCSAEVTAEHPHLLETAKRQILCSCEACAILFTSNEAAHYRRIPRQVRRLSDYSISDEQWESLMIPINLAFFYREQVTGRMIAMYPSPAGATESLLTLDAWEQIAADNPALQRLQPEVETLLINRVGTTREYFIAPSDECFRLVGIIRLHWKGLSGGAEVWQQIQHFFEDLRRKSGSYREAIHA